jgi:copper chaperone
VHHGSIASERSREVIEFTVNDMTCGHCASTITRAVKEVDAASRCEIDLGARKVRIESAQPSAEFRAAIEEAGYTPVG